MKIQGHAGRVLLLLVLAYFFFVLGNGGLSLTGPDEVFYSQTAREMMQHKSWIVPYLFDEPQFEKPIVTFGLLRLSFELFGVSSFTARLFPALFAAVGVVAIYLLGVLGFRDERKAFLSAGVLMSGGLYVGLARSVFTDMFFSVFILLCLLCFFWAYVRQERRTAGLLLACASAGLAVLAKGPLGALIPAAIVFLFLLLRRDLKFLFCGAALWGGLLLLAIAVPWYAYMIDRFGHSFTHEFFYNDHIRRLLEAEHRRLDKWWFYPVTMVGGMFPWSLFTLAAVFPWLQKLRNRQEPIFLFTLCWVAVVWVVFQVAHSKLASYIFPLFPALALITADFLCESILKGAWRRLLSLATWGTLAAFLFLPVGLGAALVIYRSYVTSAGPVYGLIGMTSLLAAAGLYLVVRRRLWAYAKLLMAVVPLILACAFFALPQVEPYASSRDLCKYLLANYHVDNQILCSRPYARGVRFYTDREVAVLGVGDKPFFSPHPIPILNSDDQAREFLRKQGDTFCVFSKKSMRQLERLASEGFRVALLTISGDQYLLRVDSLSPEAEAQEQPDATAGLEARR